MSVEALGVVLFPALSKEAVQLTAKSDTSDEVTATYFGVFLGVFKLGDDNGLNAQPQ